MAPVTGSAAHPAHCWAPHPLRPWRLHYAAPPPRSEDTCRVLQLQVAGGDLVWGGQAQVTAQPCPG